MYYKNTNLNSYGWHASFGSDRYMKPQDLASMSGMFGVKTDVSFIYYTIQGMSLVHPTCKTVGDI